MNFVGGSMLTTQAEVLKRGQHPNRIPVEGSCCLLDVPSDLGAHTWDYNTGTTAIGPRIIVPSKVAEEHLENFLGQGLCALGFPHEKYGPFELHADRSKVGFISEAFIRDKKLWVRGFLFALDFPEVLTAIEGGELGMCFSARMPYVKKVDEKTVELERAIFTGAAIMRKDCCAFHGTEICISA
jgi:hypothetical protein